MKKHTTKLLNIIAILGLTHLVVFYTAMAQTSADQPLNYHPDAPFWLALQCFFAQWLTYKSYNITLKNKLSNVTSIAKVYLASGSIFILFNTIFVLAFESIISLVNIDLRHVVLTIILSMLLHLLLGGTLLAVLLFNEAKQQHIAYVDTQNLLAKSQINALQQQLDPHFLFNNLNVLSALIQQDPDEADDFLDSFCSLYRYMLETHKNQLISLEKELEFTDRYLYLLNKRFPNAFDFKIDISLVPNQVELVSGALQLALENIVKHNQLSKTYPLSIYISNNESSLVIVNSYKPKYVTTHPDSLNLGLRNLNERCKLLIKREISIEKSNETFSLSLPLVQTKAIQAQELK